MAPASFSIIIGNHNALRYARGCLESVLRADYDNFEVIFVDVASSDGSAEYVTSRYTDDPRVRVIRSEVNCGNAGVNNIGVREARKDILIFLDSDTLVAPNWLKELGRAFDDDHMLGAAQPAVLNLRDSEKTTVIQNAGMFMLDFCGWSWSLLAGQDYSLLSGKRDKIEVGIASGAVLAVRRSAGVQAGWFDERFFMYFEENDLCWRIWLTGYTVAVVPSSVIWHLGGDARKFTVGYGPTRAFKSFHYAKNVLRMVLKNYGRKNLKYVVTSILYTFLLELYSLYAERDYVSIRSFGKALIWNLKNAGDTLSERRVVQVSVRRLDDDYVLGHLSKGLGFSAIVDRLRRNRVQLKQMPLYPKRDSHR